VLSTTDAAISYCLGALYLSSSAEPARVPCHFGDAGCTVPGDCLRPGAEPPARSSLHTSAPRLVLCFQTRREELTSPPAAAGGLLRARQAPAALWCQEETWLVSALSLDRDVRRAGSARWGCCRPLAAAGSFSTDSSRLAPRSLRANRPPSARKPSRGCFGAEHVRTSARSESTSRGVQGVQGFGLAWGRGQSQGILQQCFCEERRGEAACRQPLRADLQPACFSGEENADFFWKVTAERYTVLLARDFAFWKQIMMFCYSVSFEIIIQAENPWQPLCEGRGQFWVSPAAKGLSAAVCAARWIYSPGCLPLSSQRSLRDSDCCSSCFSTAVSRRASLKSCLRERSASRRRPLACCSAALRAGALLTGTCSTRGCFFLQEPVCALPRFSY